LGCGAPHLSELEKLYLRPKWTGCTLPSCKECKSSLTGFYDPVFILYTFEDRERVKEIMRKGYKGWDRVINEEEMDNIIDNIYPEIIGKINKRIEKYKGDL
jgi:hypothetical protein